MERNYTVEQTIHRVSGLEIEHLLVDLAAIEQNIFLLNPEALGERLDALERLVFMYEVLRVDGHTWAEHRSRVAELRARLESINNAFFAQIRDWLRTAHPPRAAIRSLLQRYSSYGDPTAERLHLDYEPVDHLIDGVLQVDTFRGQATIEDPDFVHLEDTPIRVLFDLIDHVPLREGDRFCDLGSGLGRVAIVVYWLTGVPTWGIEIQPAYWAFAQQCAAFLGLHEVTFIRGDAKEVDLSMANVFYLFTPFKGRTLRRVLDRLASEARERPITLCTYGAVSLVVAQEPWLQEATGNKPHEFSLGIWQSR